MTTKSISISQALQHGHTTLGVGSSSVIHIDFLPTPYTSRYRNVFPSIWQG